MGKKGPLWWRESDWLLRGSSAANQILLRHSGPILSVSTPISGGNNQNLNGYNQIHLIFLHSELVGIL